MYDDALPSLSSSLATRGGEIEREQKETEREGRVQSLWVLSALADDMRGNELLDFMHQRRDALHCLDCQRFPPHIGEMRSPIISFHPLHTSFSDSLCQN